MVESQVTASSTSGSGGSCLAGRGLPRARLRPLSHVNTAHCPCQALRHFFPSIRFFLFPACVSYSYPIETKPTFIMDHNGACRTKAEVILSLSNLKSPLSDIVDLCRHIGKADNQLKHFSVIAEHLPALTGVFSSIQEHLESTTQETCQIRAIHEAADSCLERIHYLKNLCQVVGQSQNKVDDYRKAVKDGGGKTLEMVMMDLLQYASSAAVPPLVADKDVEALNRALEQVSLLLSLEGQHSGAHVSFTNLGPGSQFYHGGKGNVNSCSGSALQVTGENHGATYNYGLPERPPEKKD